MLRLFYFLLLPALLSFAACRTTAVSTPSSPELTDRPEAAILTVILTVNPALDTVTVTNIIRGPGSMREDYPQAVPAPTTGHLLFSFLGPEDRILRQTTLPYPRANRYEVPHEDGHIEQISVPEAERVLLLRTNFSTSLLQLRITGQTPDGQRIDQTVDLSRR